ncbi:hydroxymethylglutaryl-CoA synthase [Clostridium autoethanogenum]|uniref:Hydroxymethylglutaryl-CoA synthase n=1 Tax=Clostridium autoethanogenum DSM 10061 TaxID=1341692 RepID=A0ABN4BJ64_9CLOT|nr:hydroxymethylglutaryl-CoA synthase [Clostridium autoethanogenum]AGY77787.1 hydroxymethylglutaryl-CoA synthase [Clostridium autoethanogenum DSM 10061]ALU37922.1 Beta-ketoacyl-[acyl-carrier-protein] synthase III-containing protein [Clostridium autoethanogenum DSM 10061]OVY49727.1 3-oxoacyl-[acyl-carrier-protein] synthase 3 [Clostridium autoethanogenum]
MNKVGIISYGVSLPKKRLAVEEIIELWQNSSLDLIKNKQGVKERGVLGFDEDCNTFSVAAAKEAFKQNGNAKEIGALYYGTCTNPYDSRPSSTIVQEALDMDYTTKCVDVQFSTKSGTTAMINAMAMVGSGISDKAMAIGVDTINRHTAPGDLLEPYASSGACAVVLGTEEVIATIDGIESYSFDLSDGFRVEGERYIRSGMLLGSAKNEVGLYANTVKAGQNLMKKLGSKPEDYKYAVFQQNTPRTSYGIAGKLGFTKEQVAPSIYADAIGDTGSASAMIGLAKVLDVAKPGDKILVVSYGFGAGADAIALTVTDAINQIRGKAKTIQSLVENKTMVDYKTAIKSEYKYIRHSYPLNAYL